MKVLQQLAIIQLKAAKGGILMVFLTYSKVQDGQYFVHQIYSLCDTLLSPLHTFEPIYELNACVELHCKFPVDGPVERL